MKLILIQNIYEQSVSIEVKVPVPICRVHKLLLGIFLLQNTSFAKVYKTERCSFSVDPKSQEIDDESDVLVVMKRNSI